MGWDQRSRGPRKSRSRVDQSQGQASAGTQPSPHRSHLATLRRPRRCGLPTCSSATPWPHLCGSPGIRDAALNQADRRRVRSPNAFEGPHRARTWIRESVTDASSKRPNAADAPAPAKFHEFRHTSFQPSPKKTSGAISGVARLPISSPLPVVGEPQAHDGHAAYELGTRAGRPDLRQPGDRTSARTAQAVLDRLPRRLRDHPFGGWGGGAIPNRC